MQTFKLPKYLKKYSKSELIMKYAKKHGIKVKILKISRVKVSDFIGLSKIK